MGLEYKPIKINGGPNQWYIEDATNASNYFIRGGWWDNEKYAYDTNKTTPTGVYYNSVDEAIETYYSYPEALENYYSYTETK